MPDPSQPHAGTLDIAVSTQDGDIYHATRSPDGTWSRFDLVFRHTSSRNAVRQVDIHLNANGAGVFAIMGDRSILQRISPKFRGGWNTPVAISGGIDINHFATDAASPDGGLIAVSGAPGPSRLTSAHYDRFRSQWTALTNPTPAPDLTTLALPYITGLSTDFANDGHPARLVLTDEAGGLYATQRLSSPPYGYAPFLDVRTQAGDPGFMTGVDICSGGKAWFVCAPTDLGGLVYTLWSPAGTWTPFDDVKAKAGDPGVIQDVSVSFFDGAFVDPAEQVVHVLVATDGGGLYHAMRRSDGTFSPFDDVKAQAGDPGPVTSVATTVDPWRYP